MKWHIKFIFYNLFLIISLDLIAQDYNNHLYLGSLNKFYNNSYYDVRSSNSNRLSLDDTINKGTIKTHFGVKIINGTSAIKNSISEFEYSMKSGQILINGGVFGKYKKFKFLFSPLLQSAFKQYYTPFANNQNSFASDRYYNLYANWIDSEAFYSQSKAIRVFPGISFVSYDLSKLKIKLSTESIKWGPGNIHNLIFSDNNPGFAHVSIETNQKIFKNSLGLDFQLISGVLNSFNSINLDTNYAINGTRLYRNKIQSNRIISAFNVSINPKFLKGIILGFSRSSLDYANNSNGKFNLGQLIPVFKKRLLYEDTIKRDQYASFFFKFISEKNKFQFYGEIGRNDFSYNLRDFIMSPIHSGAYMIGLSKQFVKSKVNDVLIFEFSSTKLTQSRLLRDEPMWYSHYQVRQGYTNFQRILGDYIGGGSQAFSLKWNKTIGNKLFSLSYDRIINNSDMAKYMFGENAKNWVTNSVLFTYINRLEKQFPTIQFGLTFHKNYQWNVNNNLPEKANLLVPYLSYSIHF